MKPTGWYLGLRYMQGAGLVARAGEKIEPERRGAQFIFADRVLCAATNWRKVLDDWWDALSINGCLILWLPDCRHCDLEPGEAKLTLEDVTHALDHRIGWQLHEADLIDGHIYVVWRKNYETLGTISPWRKREKHALVARTGAHGDALMASSILPRLKRQGWTISFISREAGCEILKSDPHIDELILLAAGQVKEEELPHYWLAWSKRFDRFINLTCSVEGDLLKQPARGDYWWSDDQRRKQCKHSYLRYLHNLAAVPGPYKVRFYPTAEEKLWAQSKAKEYGSGRDWSNSPPLEGGVRGGGVKLGPTSMVSSPSRRAPNLAPPLLTSPTRGEKYRRSPGTDRSRKSGGFVLWCLRGSAVHKWWPYAPEAICQLLAKTNLNFVLTGDAEAEPLARAILKAVEKYHGDTSRIYKLVNTNSIREIMTLAHHAAAVVGPETGVMNAVSLQPVPKVLLLSHSSASNLSDDWIATTALAPTSGCYPCHRLHYNHDWCPQDIETGAAVCAASIKQGQVVNALIEGAKNKISQPWWHNEKCIRAA